MSRPLEEAGILPVELETLSLELLDDDDVAVLRLDRPHRNNAQVLQSFYEHGTVARALRDSSVRALVLTGAGEKAFCVGFDLDEIDSLTRMGSMEFVRFMEHASGGALALRQLPFPVIAALHGPVMGGGLALALGCDIRYAAPTAKFGAAFLKVGLSVGELGTSWHLTRLVGQGVAADIGTTGRVVGAQEAERIGLVNRVVPSERLFDEALATARLIASNSPGGVRMTKRAIQRNAEIGSYRAALELENRGQALLSQTEDMPEALAAFKEQRVPRFSAR